MDQQIQDFVNKVYRYQTECGYSLDMIPVYFVGGGAVVMRNFGKYQQPNIHYVLDVKANAKGFTLHFLFSLHIHFSSVADQWFIKSV